MSPLDLVRLAIARLRSSRLRAALTMLGVIIGVASVVALVAVGSAIGGTLGAKVGRRIPPDVLRALVVLLGLIVAIKLIVD